ncbi:class I SAM-dependent methyltransferase [Paramagnetospirillum magneticum]|uniref:SAM-dependent methyltransferase n=1 Tax=Paramagnetospirillum magneticum (strain ATCC 700264 / AMB-1) TaxID=342108 RepID=Q2W3N8_PARM1|nr:class I SAM-dependent methyltransferase [Paramagnetospirillum magneticum]BAE51537.1 SAM-dependent methyltransferase [Paramagnetospirillum magneticum AMB-1]
MNNKTGWIDYWDGDVSVYTGARHLKAHYRELFAGIEPLLPAGPFTLLDYGCGEALMAPDIAARGGRVFLYDAAGGRRPRLRQRYSHLDGVVVPDDLSVLDGQCDVVLLISVIQYVPRDGLPALLAQLRRALRPGGKLIVGDILSPANSVVGDVSALLRFAWREGFVAEAVRGLMRTLNSNYNQRRKTLGLSTYSFDEIRGQLDAAGFDVTALAENVGHARHRRSVLACRRD